MNKLSPQLFCLLILWLPLSGFAATAYNTGTSGDWTTAGTWSGPIAGGPTATDSIAFNSSSAWTVDLLSDRTLTALSFANTGSATFNNTGGTTLNLGSGTLTKSGTGTLTLNTNVTTSGTAALDAGTINGSGTLTAATFTTSGAAVVSANLAGTGSTLSVAGIGSALTLSGNNTYTGGTTVTTTLRINSTNAIGSGNLTLNGGAIIDNTSGAALTLATTNTITNSSQFTFTGTNDLNFGAGQFALANNNRTLNFGGINSTLTLGGISSTVDGTRSFTLNNLSGASGNRLVIGTFNLAPVSANTTAYISTLTTNADTTMKITGVVSNGNAAANRLTKVGTGTLILEGANTYSGATSLGTSGGSPIVGGTLLVNNTTGSGTGSGAVNFGTLGGTLGGTGTISGLVTTAGVTSVITPGVNSAATLTFSGGLNAASGAEFFFDLGTTSDLLSLGSGVFTGSTASNGLVFNFADSGGIQAGVTYTLINFGSSTGLAVGDLFNNSTGAGFTVNQWLINPTNLQVVFSAVPEPSTNVIFLFGGALLFVLNRFRKTRPSLPRH